MSYRNVLQVVSSYGSITVGELVLEDDFVIYKITSANSKKPDKKPFLSFEKEKDQISKKYPSSEEQLFQLSQKFNEIFMNNTIHITEDTIQTILAPTD